MIKKNGFTGLMLAGSICFLAACENDLSRVNTISSKLFEVSVETSREIQITYSDSTKVKAVMTSPLLESYQTEEPYDLMPEGLHVIFYDDSLQVESTLTAKYGRRDLEKKTMEVRDSVVVISADGRKLETERLVWEEEGDRIYSDRFVQITDAEGYVTQGIGLETNSKFKPYKILEFSGELPFKNTGAGADSLSRTDSLSRADSLSRGDRFSRADSLSRPDQASEPDQAAGPDSLSGAGQAD